MKLKRILSALLAVTMTTGIMAFNAPLASAKEAAHQIFVSPQGDDTEDGSEEFPVRTFQMARQKLIEYTNENGIPEGGVEVVFREGTYSLGASGYDFGVSGSNGNYVTFKAYEGEDVVFDGSTKIPTDEIYEVTDASELARLPEEARGKVYYIDLSNVGVETDGLKVTPFYEGGKAYLPDIQFYLNSTAMTEARWPNGKEKVTYGLVTKEAERVIKDGDINATAYAGSTGEFIFQLDEDRIERWANATPFYATGDWYVDWFQHSITIDSVNTETRELTCDDDMPFYIRDMKKMFVHNLLEEVDVPGEYYVDKEINRLYFCTNGAIEDAEISYSTLARGIKVDMAEHVKIDGITLQNISGHGIVGSMKQPNENIIDNIHVINCTIRNIGQDGINIYNGRNILIADNMIYNVGGRAIMNNGSNNVDVFGWDDFEDFNNYYKNNYIYNYSMYGKSYVTAIGAYCMADRIVNNTVHGAPHMVFSAAQNGEISFNEVYDVARDCSDSGIVYNGRSFLGQATVNNNYFHGSLNSTSHYSGIYLDDNMSGFTMTNNIIQNVHFGVAMSGIHNTLENNIIMGKPKKASASIAVDKRGANPDTMNVIQNAILKKKDIINANKDIWMKNRPWLFEALDEELMIKEGWENPHVTVKNNITMQAAALNICPEAYQYGEVVNNYETNERLAFKDYKNGDYTLTEEALVNFPGVKPIDFYSIGVQPSENCDQTLVQRRLRDCVVLDIDNPNAFVDNEKVMIDKEDAAVVPAIINDRTMVPFRFIAEAFGAEVAWNGDTRTVTIKKGNTEISMTIGEASYTLNGKKIEMDTPAQIVNDRTMVPVRVVSESLNQEVFWDADGLVILGYGAESWDSDYDNYRIYTIFEALK